VKLIARLKAGDGAAWTDFIERYRRLIFSAINRVNGRYGAEWDEAVMENLFAEVLFKLLRRNAAALTSWQGRCRLETWIYRIVRNVCIDELRKAGRRGEVAEVDQERGPSGAGGDEKSSRQERVDLRLSLEQAIDQVLSAKEALAVHLIYFEGYTYREVGERFGMTVGAVSGMVYRALGKMKQYGGIARYWNTE
jgi:RNA polymerase sigma-70 factor (ECF subfamily)